MAHPLGNAAAREYASESGNLIAVKTGKLIPLKWINANNKID